MCPSFIEFSWFGCYIHTILLVSTLYMYIYICLYPVQCTVKVFFNLAILNGTIDYYTCYIRLSHGYFT